LLGPGDELSVIFYGKLNESSTVEINRDGFVDFPELGPIMIAGLTFSEAKKDAPNTDGVTGYWY
jgi:protein involved in polysaccharide export with SLBB domain